MKIEELALWARAAAAVATPISQTATQQAQHMLMSHGALRQPFLQLLSKQFGHF